MSRDIMTEIQDEISHNTVILYMKGTPSFPMCGFSAATVTMLQELGYPFAHVNVLADQEKREAIKVFSHWPTIPQLYVKGKFVGGCDIVQELHASGALREILAGAFADAGSTAAAG